MYSKPEESFELNFELKKHAYDSHKLNCEKQALMPTKRDDKK